MGISVRVAPDGARKFRRRRGGSRRHRTRDRSRANRAVALASLSSSEAGSAPARRASSRAASASSGARRSPAASRASRPRSTPTPTSGCMRRCRSASALRLPVRRARRRDARAARARTSACRTAKACRRAGRRPTKAARARPRAPHRRGLSALPGAPRTATSTGRRASSRRSARGLDVRDRQRSPRSKPRLADTVVVAAGADTADLLRPLGIELPIERGEPLPLPQRADPRAPPRAARRVGRAALRREAARRRARARERPRGARATRRSGAHGAQTVRAGIERAAARARATSPSRCSSHGEYDVTPGSPADPRPRADDGLYVAAGFSGHGFMIAPAVAPHPRGRRARGAARRGARDSRRRPLRRESPRCPSRRSSRMFWQLLANGLVTGSVIAIAAVGVSLIYGILGLVNFAYGDFMAFGALAAVRVQRPARPRNGRLGAARHGRHRRPLARARRRPVAAAARAPRRLHEPLPRLDRARARAAPGAPPRRYGPQPQHVRRRPVQGLRDRQRAALGSPAVTIIVAAVAIVPGRGLALALDRSDGRCAPLADDRALAAVAGIDVGRVIALHVDPLAACSPGSRACSPALVQSSFDPNFGFTLLLPIFAAVVLGGIGSAYGALARRARARPRDGALDLAGASRRRESGLQAGRRVRRPIGALMVRPQGLFGRARVV